MLDRYLSFLEQHYRAVIALIVILVIGAGSGVSQLSTTSDIRSYFNPKALKVQQMRAMEAEFGADNRILFYIAPRPTQAKKSGQVFEPKVLKLIEDLSNDAWQIPHARRVSSIQNHQHIETTGDVIVVEALYRNADGLPANSLSAIKQNALNSKSLAGFLINADASVSGISISLNIDQDSPDAATAAVAFARTLRDKYQALYPEVEIQLSGFTYQTEVFRETVEKEVRMLFLICIALIIVLLVLLLKQPQWTLLTVAVILMAVLTTEGLFGWLNGILTPATGFVPGIIMIIAIADCVHIFHSYAQNLASGLGKSQAVKQTITSNASPIIITSLCTMIGMLCLNFNESPPYHDLGNMVAFGTFLALCLSLSFLPAMLFYLPIPKNAFNKNIFGELNTFASFVIKHQRNLMIIAVILTFSFAYALSFNRISDNLNTYHKKSTQLRKTLDLIDQNLTGTNTVHFVLESGQANGVLTTQYLQDVDKLTQWLIAQDKVANVMSLSDILINLNRLGHDDSEDFNKLPNTQQSAAQLLLLYELSLPLGLSTDNLLSMDRSRSRLIVMLHNMDNTELIAFENKAIAWMKLNTSSFVSAPVSGLQMTFAYITKNILSSLIKGSITSVVLISLLLIIVLKSWKYGLLSLLPNILPALFAYGIWGILESKVGISVAFIFCMSLGIVVDDTIHFLSKYLYAKKQLLLSPEECVHYAFNTVGGALIITSIVLCCGFLVLMFSSFNPSAWMGMLLALTMVSAILIDFFFLPPLLLLVDRKRSSKQDIN